MSPCNLSNKADIINMSLYLTTDAEENEAEWKKSRQGLVKTLRKAEIKAINHILVERLHHSK